MVVPKRSLIALLLCMAAGGACAGPVNINTADASKLAAELKGVGTARAEAIVAYREAHGPFAGPDDLAKVKGIGESLIDQNRDSILVADPTH